VIEDDSSSRWSRCRRCSRDRSARQRADLSHHHRVASPAARRRIAWRAALATWITLSVFAIAGGVIFRAFGISLGAFKIAAV